MRRRRRRKPLPTSSAERFLRDGWQARGDELLEAVLADLDQLDRSVTTFADALSYLTPSQLGVVVDTAVARMVQRPAIVDGDSAAEDVVAHVSLQAPGLLAEHLEVLWDLRPNASYYYAEWPWRAASEAECDRLLTIATKGRGDDRDRATRALLERRRLASSECWHIVFPEDDSAVEAPHLMRHHPTWRAVAGDNVQATFGGLGGATCGRCGGQLHRLVSFPEVPRMETCTRSGALELATCISCLGWEPGTAAMFYAHDRNGDARPLDVRDGYIAPEFPAGPLNECAVTLVPTAQRWRFQDWALSNNRQNLNRVGGEATWIQNADYPECPGCGQPMPSLLQLDSDPPIDPGRLWGSGGIAYVFWCDACAVSAVMWQCT